LSLSDDSDIKNDTLNQSINQACLFFSLLSLRFVVLLVFCVTCVSAISLFGKPAAPSDIWSFCGTSQDHFTIQTVTITPDPPQLGQNLTVALTGSLDEIVTSGSVFVQINYGPINLLNNTYGLCGILQAVGISCPVPTGNLQFKLSELIPSDSPHGSYSGKIVITDQNEQEITCIALAFNLGAKIHEKKTAKKMIARIN